MREQQGEAGETEGRGEWQQGENRSDGPMSSNIWDRRELTSKVGLGEAHPAFEAPGDVIRLQD